MTSQVPVSGGEFLQDLAEKVATRSGAHAVFGPPVERGGVTVIPVARVRFGFGGGGARKAGEGDMGQGGGGGSAGTPVGFIEIRDGSAEFRTIPDPAADSLRTLAVLGGTGLGLWLVLRGLRGVFRR